MMASSTSPNCLFHFSSLSSSSSSSSISNSTTTTHLPLSSSQSIFNGCSATSLTKSSSSSRISAKFDKFQGGIPQEILQDATPPPSLEAPEEEDGEQEDDDSCLPSDLEGAVRQSGEASADFVSSGGMRAIVELLIPQLKFLDEEGAQAELWELSRVFLDTLIEETGGQRVKAVFPDAGAAALLKYRWKDAAFGFASLSDRKPITSEDEIVVMVVPDYQMLGYVEKLAATLSDDPPRPLIMWNPRLISEDVGVGFNVRKLRRYFLRTFTTVYSMRPMESGAVFRCYPGLWKVFYDDKDRPNRYLLAKELIQRPDAEELEMIFGNVDESSEKGQSLFDQAAGMFSSLNRFMRQKELRKSAVAVFGSREVQHRKRRETTFYSLKKLHAQKRKIVDKRASKSRKIRLIALCFRKYNVYENIVNFMAPETMAVSPLLPDLNNLFG